MNILKELEGFRSKLVAKNEMVFMNGDEIDNCYYIVKGKIKTNVLSYDGEERTLLIYDEGELFGETSIILGDEGRKSSAMAIKQTILKVIPKDVFLRTIKENSELAFKVAKWEASNVSFLTSRFSNLTFLSAPERINNFLHSMVRHNKTHYLNISQDMIAENTSCSRMTVSRALKVLVEEKAISLGYRSITILDESKIN